MKLGPPAVVLWLTLVSVAQAQISGAGRTPVGCFYIAEHGSIQVRGRLSVHAFPGAPGFNSLANGDQPERAYILKLPKPICIDDGGDFADPATRIDTVQVTVNDDKLWAKLRSGLGRNVVVEGKGFAAFDGHHHAPLMVFADSVRVLGKEKRPQSTLLRHWLGPLPG